MEPDLVERIGVLTATLKQAEAQAKEFFVAARAQRLSFGLDYNHLDDDVARLLGRLRYMELIAQRHQDAQRDDA
jgi:hypothetical protein